MFGLSDSVGKLSGAVGKGLAELTQDQDYLAARSSTDVPRNVGEGLLQTVGDVSGGLVKGVSGLAAARTRDLPFPTSRSPPRVLH